jgi:hypothetical protein
MSQKIKIYQIFYDEESKSKLDPAFLPLDNSLNIESDWFEFSAIRNYLLCNDLDQDTFYGFLSPNFCSKSQFRSHNVIDLISTYGSRIDVALFSIRWDHIAYFTNPFEQGECIHPGILKATQKFLDSINLDIDLKNFITHSQTAVYSNYIIAKPSYWLKWLSLANEFYDYAKVNSEVNQPAIHRAKDIALKAFIQERLSSIILSMNKFRVATPDQGMNGLITDSYYSNNSHTRRLLIACDILKERYCNTGDSEYLKMFYKLRKEVVLNTSTHYGSSVNKLIMKQHHKW